jgi:transcriptional regulator with XRE-family HTH domain
MPPKPFVRTLRAQWLGQELRSLRDARGMTLKMVAAHLRRDMSALSRYERGEWPIGRADVLALLDLYGFHHAAERERMLRLAEEVWITDRWSENYSDILQPSFIDFPWLESRAERICSYHASVIPGLFQLRDYAERVIRSVDGDELDEEGIQLCTDLRMERQAVLAAPHQPWIDVVIAESALRRRIGRPSLCHAQMLHLLECASLTRVIIRVLPSDVDLHRGLDGSFWVFQMPHPYPAVAYLDYLGGQLYLEAPKSERFVRAYHGLSEIAMAPQASVRFIERLAKELE